MRRPLHLSVSTARIHPSDLKRAASCHRGGLQCVPVEVFTVPDMKAVIQPSALPILPSSYFALSEEQRKSLEKKFTSQIAPKPASLTLSLKGQNQCIMVEQSSQMIILG